MTRCRRASRPKSMTTNRSSSSMLLTRPCPHRNGSPAPSSRTSISTPRMSGTAVSLARRSRSRGADLLQWLAVETAADHVLEVRARDDVVVRAGDGVLDGDAGGLRLGDALVELGELAPGEVAPRPRRRRPRLHELTDLGQREADVGEEEDGAHHAHGTRAVPALARHADGAAPVRRASWPMVRVISSAMRSSAPGPVDFKGT